MTGEMGWKLDVAIHNPPDAKIGSITFTPCLIFPDSTAGSLADLAMPKPYVRLPGKMCILQHPMPVTLQPGGWVNISFEVLPEGYNHNFWGQKFDMVLRVLSDGPPRDIPFKVEMKYE